VRSVLQAGKDLNVGSRLINFMDLAYSIAFRIGLQVVLEDAIVCTIGLVNIRLKGFRIIRSDLRLSPCQLIDRSLGYNCPSTVYRTRPCVVNVTARIYQ
jgi:hypothetical protein